MVPGDVEYLAGASKFQEVVRRIVRCAWLISLRNELLISIVGFEVLIFTIHDEGMQESRRLLNPHKLGWTLRLESKTLSFMEAKIPLKCILPVFDYEVFNITVYYGILADHPRYEAGCKYRLAFTMSMGL